MEKEIIKILNRLRDEMSEEEIQEYDIKCEYKELQQLQSNLEKICHYKNKYDCDSSLFTMICLWIVYNFEVNKEENICEFSGIYIPNKINKIKNTSLKYEVLSDNFNYRGDTINSCSTTFNEFLRRYKYCKKEIEDFLIYNRNIHLPKLKITWEKCIVSNMQYFTNIISKEIPSANEFFRLTHTIGNFILVPFSNKQVNFNTKRGFGSFSKDYWDIALLCIYNYYHNIKNTNYTLFNLFGKKQDVVQLVENWLDKFCSDNDTNDEKFLKFIQINYLENFIDEQGKPKKLWAGHLEENSNVMPIIDDSNNFYEEYFTNASKMIKERSKSIAKKIKFVLHEISNDEIVKFLDIKK